MAYGKDSAQLKSMGGFRRPTDLRQQSGMQGDRSRATRGGGGSKVPRFVGQFTPPTVGQALIRICKATYDVELAVEGSKGGETEKVPLSYFPYVSHWNNRNKQDTVCSGGPWSGNRKFALECLGCENFFSSMVMDTKTGKKKFGHVSKREMNAISIFNYANFHLSPQLDSKTGQPRINAETGTPYMSWQECSGRNCPGCNDGDKTEKGRMQHWSLGTNHWNSLLDKNDKLKQDCKSCETENSILVTGYFCQNPDCGEPIIDMSSTSHTDAEIAKLIKDPMMCPSCRTREYAQCIYECSQCEDPQQASIFDVDMKVNKVASSDPNNKQTTVTVGTTYLRPISAEFSERFKALALDKIFAADGTDRQIQVFGQSDEAPTKGAAAYSKSRL